VKDLKPIECAHTNNYVRDSRASTDGIRRRRVCTDCGHRWTTYEISSSYRDQLRREIYLEAATRLAELAEQ
jgi:transcriptional regulator NrdR family protein